MKDIGSWIANGRKALWLNPLLALLAVIPELTGSFRAWVFVLAGALAFASVATTAHQWLRPRKLTPLMNMATGLVVPLCTLSLVAIWNVFSRFPGYQLASAYWPLYVIVAVVVLYFGLRYAHRRWRTAALDLREQVVDGTIPIEAVNDFFFGHPSLRWQQEHWNLLAAAVGIAATATVAVSAIGGRDYLWLALSVVGFPIFIPPIASTLTMRWFFSAYLPSSDIEITDDAYHDCKVRLD